MEPSPVEQAGHWWCLDAYKAVDISSDWLRKDNHRGPSRPCSDNAEVHWATVAQLDDERILDGKAVDEETVAVAHGGCIVVKKDAAEIWGTEAAADWTTSESDEQHRTGCCLKGLHLSPD